MGQLLNPGLWQFGLDGHHEVLTALARWMESVNFDLEIIHWFDDGRSDRPVALVLRSGKGHPEQLVLKFCEPGTRTAALSEAWEESPGYQHHLAKIDQVPIPVGEWTAIFLSIAGGDQDEFQPLSRYRRDPSLPACLREIAASVIGDWNPHRTSHGQRTAGEVLQPIVRRHIGAAEKWARSKGLPVGGDSPFALVSGVDAGRSIPGVMLGKAHHGAADPQRVALSSLAGFRGLAGDPVGGAAAYEDLLADQLRVLGTDHRDTPATRDDLTQLRDTTDPAGDATEPGQRSHRGRHRQQSLGILA
jgi:hypothetical protein